MKNTAITVLFIACLVAAAGAHAQTVRHVWTNSPFPGAPHNAWTNAARTIQDAIDAASAGAGDWVWVTNGVYDTGGRAQTGLVLTNRALINKAIRVQSVNGPSNTFIVGRWHDPGVTAHGDAAVRCVYLAAGSSLAGFTLTNGATLAAGADADLRGGGAYCAAATTVISNCVIVANRSQNYAGGAYGGGNYYNCVFSGNTAGHDGGATYAGGDYHACEFYDNYGRFGGANRVGGNFYNCIFSGNTADRGGGAAAYVTALYNCDVINNTAGAGYGEGGGTAWANLYNCRFFSNRTVVRTSNSGGGAYLGAGRSAYNTVFAGNAAMGDAGGVIGPGHTYNCTITGNSAGGAGGGTSNTTNWNAIVFNNLAPSASNHVSATFGYSLAAPLPAGEGNIDAPPVFVNPGSGFGTNHVAGDYRLKRASPGIDAGINFGYMSDPDDAYGRNFDLDGNPRIQHGTVDMGAYEIRIPRGSVFSVE